MRIEQLTFTRFIAAASIVIYHYGGAVSIFKSEYLNFIFTNANVGVSYFFLLSGFVMMIAYNRFFKINFKNYMRNRMARIYPVYFLAILLLFLAYLLKFKGGIVWPDILSNVLMIQAWIPGKATSFNYPAWSLSVELVFYLCFPLLYNFLFKKIRIRYIITGSLVFWIISQIFVHLTIQKEIISLPVYSNEDLLYHPLMHINEFLVGTVTGLVFLKNNKKSNNTFVIILLLCILFFILKFPVGLNYHNGLLAVIFIPLIYFISGDNSFISDFFSKRFFVFLGEISYSVYILQFPVYMLIMKNNMLLKILKLNETHDVDVIFLIYFISLILFSSFVYIYIEKPMRDFIKIKL